MSEEMSEKLERLDRVKGVEVLLRVAQRELKECYELGALQQEANLIEEEVDAMWKILLSLSRLKRHIRRQDP